MSADTVNATDVQNFSRSQQPGIADDRFLNHLHGTLAHVQHPVDEVGYRHPAMINILELYTFFNDLRRRYGILNGCYLRILVRE
ncbi:hypothetical protein [Desulfolutivibrio sp.]|uniref:hypothetical protein n=1 Tax=Desulfolutivibrio sp. TaxID=2773296 RepID=UPI002F964A40